MQHDALLLCLIFQGRSGKKANCVQTFFGCEGSLPAMDSFILFSDKLFMDSCTTPLFCILDSLWLWEWQDWTFGAAGVGRICNCFSFSRLKLHHSVDMVVLQRLAMHGLKLLNWMSASDLSTQVRSSKEQSARPSLVAGPNCYSDIFPMVAFLWNYQQICSVLAGDVFAPFGKFIFAVQFESFCQVMFDWQNITASFSFCETFT